MAATAQQIAQVLAGMRAESARLVSAAAQPAPERLSTGAPGLDALTGGGLVRGRICELIGPRGSGRMSAVLAMTAAVQAKGELVALVDVADALDPRSAHAAGVQLPRLLWIRPRSVVDGLKAADWVLDAGGFGLVVLYVAGVNLRPERRFARPRAVPQPLRSNGEDCLSTGAQTGVTGDAPWVKLARRAERGKSAVVVVGDRPLVGTVAAVSLQAARARGRWVGGERGAPVLLDGADGKIVVARSKLGPPAATATLPLRAGK